MIPIFVSVAQQPNSGLDRLSFEVYRRTNTQQDSSKQVIGLSQWPLPSQHLINTIDEHP